MSVAELSQARPPGHAFALARLRLPRWSAAAWGAIALVCAFVALTWWWLTQDRGVPGTEPGVALAASLVSRDMLHAGDLLGPLTLNEIHPPLIRTVGALGMLIGGIDPISPVIAENLLFVPLLALGCYQTAKLAAGPRAGLLAVVFALGAPLMTEQFHVLMLDAPQAALVALVCWLVLASDRFRRLGLAALAGAAVGAGAEVKQQFAVYVAGLLAVVLLRGGWRNWRGVAVFAAAALVVCAPWYVAHLGELSQYNDASVAGATPGTLPDRLSLGNVTWYLWGALNGWLYAPLFAIAAIGLATAGLTTARRLRAGGAAPARARTPGSADVMPALLAGALVSWVGLMATPIHVVRYLLPMTVYVAVPATVWIVRLRPRAQALATAALVLAALTGVACSLGFGQPTRVTFGATEADRSIYGVRLANQVVLYAPRAFQLAGPEREGDMLGLLRTLHRHGVQTVAWLREDESPYVFDRYGLSALIWMARLVVLNRYDPAHLPEGTALLVRGARFGTTPPCLRLADGSGVWVRFGSARSPQGASWCPDRRS